MHDYNCAVDPLHKETEVLCMIEVLCMMTILYCHHRTTVTLHKVNIETMDVNITQIAK